MDIQTKRCSRCKEVKPIDCFGVDNSRKDKLNVWCKDCKKEASSISRDKAKIRYNSSYCQEHNITEKVCARCHKEKTVSCFGVAKSCKDGLNHYCKDCRREIYQENIEQEKIARAKHYLEHKKELNEKAHSYYIEHSEKIKEYSKNWRKEHWDEVKSKRKQREENDELYRFQQQIRRLIRCSFYRGDFKKESRTAEIIGCSYEELKEHLEKTFFNNYGVEYNPSIHIVHVDHIIPISYAKSKEELIKLCHYTNLQYLTAWDNLKKKDQLDYKPTSLELQI